MEKYSSKKIDQILEYLNTWMLTQTVFKNRQQMADYLHISKSHLGNIALKNRKPSDTLLEKIVIMTGFVGNEKEMTSTNSECPYKDLADELRGWFHQQKKWKNQTEFAQYLGVCNSYISKIFTGKRLPGKEVQQKLFDITSLDIFKTEQQCKVNSTLEVGQKVIENNAEEITKDLLYIKEALNKIENFVNLNKAPNIKSRSANDSTECIANMFYTLAEGLLSFQISTPKDRENLRKLISPPDVGFVISFLRAIYDEDKFSDFIYFTKYELKRGE